MNNLKINILFLLLLISCSSGISTKMNYFPDMRGCFLLYNLKTNTFDKVIGETCKERFPACSTFKIPLAIMAFDSGVLKNEKQILKWDGKKQFLEIWNKDHNAQTWMKESVVWFSQRITPILGEMKFQKYLNDFQYGNQDLSGGITQSWLTSPSEKTKKLAISAYEQVEFIKKLWTNQLPVSKRSMELTKNITYLETSPKGFRLSGKTGSNFFDINQTIHFGWFVSHLVKDDQEYIAVTNISDLKPSHSKFFGGFRAKEITKTILTNEGLW